MTIAKLLLIAMLFTTTLAATNSTIRDPGLVNILPIGTGLLTNGTGTNTTLPGGSKSPSPSPSPATKSPSPSPSNNNKSPSTATSPKPSNPDAKAPTNTNQPVLSTPPTTNVIALPNTQPGVVTTTTPPSKGPTAFPPITNAGFIPITAPLLTRPAPAPAPISGSQREFTLSVISLFAPLAMLMLQAFI